MMSFNDEYARYKQIIEDEIRLFSDTLDCHDELKAAITYSLFAGGKRVRPIMFLACLDMLGCNYIEYVKLAVAIECVHTYSLIHDDLPALDNDDYRRGKLSNHKIFGEGMAILAGDALLNCAFELALSCVSDGKTLNAVKYLFACSGQKGMINGQAYDLYYEDRVIDDKELILQSLQNNKTGKLLTAPLVMAALISGEQSISDFEELGRLTGVIFQFSDDLLDVNGTFKEVGKTVGKDGYAGKLTAISVYGVQRTIDIIDETFLSIIKILKNFDGNTFFINFYNYIRSRRN